MGGGDLLTPMEALMWRLEGERRLSSTFGCIILLDQAPDPALLRARLATATATVARLRQRVGSSSLPARPPRWTDDPDFDLDRHVRWLDGPRDERETLELAADLVSDPFDPGHPPWDLVVLSQLPDKAALVLRMHHAVTDGQGGIGLMEQLVDVQREAPEREPDPLGAGDAPPAGSEPLERIASAASDRLAELATATTGIARWASERLHDPSSIGESGQDVAETLRSLGRQLAVFDKARSSLWADRSDRRSAVVASISFAALRDAAARAGASVNDVFVTAVLRGAAAYHRAHGSPVEELRVAVPVSTRTSGSVVQNSFSPTRVLLPSGEGLAPTAHLTLVAGALGRTKDEKATALAEPLAALAELAPWALLSRLALQQADTIDLAASNVRGVPEHVFVAGARIEALYALGPLVGVPANVTMLSYAGRADLGMHLDPRAVTEPELLRDSVTGAMHEVIEALRSSG